MNTARKRNRSCTRFPRHGGPTLGRHQALKPKVFDFRSHLQSGGLIPGTLKVNSLALGEPSAIGNSLCPVKDTITNNSPRYSTETTV